MPWGSRLLDVLSGYGLRWIWAIVFILAGLGLEFARTLAQTQPRAILLVICALLWTVIMAVAWHLSMPLLWCTTLAVVWCSFSRAWHIHRP